MKNTKKIKIPANYKKNSYSKLLYLYKRHVITLNQYDKSRKKLDAIRNSIYNNTIKAREKYDNIHNSWEKLELKRSYIKDFLRSLKVHDKNYKLLFNMLDTSNCNDDIIHYLIMFLYQDIEKKYNL